MSNMSRPHLQDIPRPTGPWGYADAEEGYEYIVSVEPNSMHYVDGNGDAHDIYIPQGQIREATDHLTNKRWDELAKYPKYENQGYQDEDYTITRYKKKPNTEEEKRGVVVKKVGDPLVKAPDGKVILYPERYRAQQ
ncbi:hypothetical protein VTK73DRAFT_6965 [Phialemonium thermophilum]|uniref:Uncharacterized protein n=1 Tax=Phialemonium thermophilum TaxID=223376 RepID=A0ABR3WHM2_9PEZI